MRRWFTVNFVCMKTAAVLALVGCGPQMPTHTNLGADVDAACGGPAWRSRQALAAEVTIHRTRQPDLNGLMFYDVRGNRLTLQFPTTRGRASFGFDGYGVWIDCPGDFAYADCPMLLQWASWVSVPYRLTDPMLRVRELRPVSFEGQIYRVAELDRPSQGLGMCALYVEPSRSRPRMACPVFPPEMIRQNPAGICTFAYEQFSNCDQVQVPTRWSIWGWDARQGATTIDPIATITLGQLRFIDADPLVFEQPTDGSIDHPIARTASVSLESNNYRFHESSNHTQE